MEAALPIILKWLAAGLPEMITALQGAQARGPVPTPVAPLNPQGWPSPLPPETMDAQPPATTTATDAAVFNSFPATRSPGIRLLQVALVAAGQQVGVDGVSGPETEKALAAVVQHIMSRVG